MFDYFSHKGETDQLSDRKPYTKTFDFTFIAGRPKNEHRFSVKKMTVTDIGVIFPLNHVLKNSKPGKNWTVSTMPHITTKSYLL